MADYPPDPKPARPASSSTNSLLVGALMLLTAALVYQTWSNGRAPAPVVTDYVPRDVTPRGMLGADEQATISVFREASPSVVFIRTKGYQRALFGRVIEKELSSGTGFVWDSQGHIVTNLHVVEQTLHHPGAELQVQFADQSVFDAEVVGGVREFDVAVLRVTAPEHQLRPIALGTSDDLEVGQLVLAIGSPFGFDQTLSTGVIGGLDRSVASESNNEEGFLNGLIQTDAAINPGNSGGPLLDSSGRMIGVNTAIVSPTGAYSGLGFAVPINSVIASVDRVLSASTGKSKAWLGLSVLSPAQAAELGVPEAIIKQGLFIKQIERGGPAAATDLQPTRQSGFRIFLGDQIAAIDGQPVTSPTELEDVLKKHSPGDQIRVEIFRRGQRGELQITVEAQKLIL